MTDLKNLLAEMSLQDKIGQLTQYNANLFLDTQAQITGPQAKLGLTEEDLARVGSVLNFSTPEEMLSIQEKHLENDPHRIPMVFMMDVIHGYRTIYPIPLGLACSFDPGLHRDCAALAAREAVASGVQVTFAPMVDYCRDPRWGRVLETCGEEPRLTAALAEAQIQGYHREGLATCVKHFAGYGGAEAGRDYNLAELSQWELREYYLPAYKACIDAGAPLLMPAFNALNGVPCTANSHLMQDILQKEWGYDGLVISDYNAIGELLKQGVAADGKEAARLAFQNGCHMEMCSSTYFHHLEELLREGAITQAQLDEAVLKILEFKERLGLFRDPRRGTDPEKAQRLCLSPEHRDTARRAAEESAVLLKNKGVLPLAKTQTVALIGPFADAHGINGFWSCNGRDEDTVTVYEGVARLIGADRVSVCRGCGNGWDDRDCSGFPEAVALAKAAGAVVLCLGEPQNYSGEGNCRTDLKLPGVQEALLQAVVEANPNTAVVLFNGRPLDLSRVDALAPAILEMWFPGTEGGNAAARLLFGAVSPSGKLSMTFPRSVGQCPIYYNHPGNGRPHWTDTVRHKGYASDYIDCPTLPLYGFGYGLSYSQFRYGGMTVSDRKLPKNGSIQVSLTVKNEGAVPAKEVAQLYYRDPVASVVRPVQQLIAFQKLDFLPGEEKTVTFAVTEEMLRFWNQRGEHLSEPGEVVLMAGCAHHFECETSVYLTEEEA